MNRSSKWWLFALITVLTVFGVITVFEASVVESYQQFGDKLHFVKLQSMWAAIGFTALGLTSLIPYQFYKKFSQPVMIAALLLLIAVLIPGIGFEAQGARRWIDLGFAVLQPSEFTKLAIIMYLSSWLANHQRIGPFVFIIGVVLGLIMLQPDLGTALIVGGVGLLLYYVSGGSLKRISLTLLVGLVIGGILIIASPYRLNRLKTFIDPTSDPLGTSYHIRQVLIAIGSGGISGQGIGKSRQKYQYLPEASTDSIFAIIAEETGFIGALCVIGALFSLIHHGLRIAKDAHDPFGQLLGTGIISWIGLQIIINLSAMVALIPLTGVPLPLISYGGSSLIVILAALGIVINIARQTEAATHHKHKRLVWSK